MILPFMEQSAAYSAFNLQIGVSLGQAQQTTAMYQVVNGYVCPSDGESAKFSAGVGGGSLGYNNYFGSIGNTPSMYMGSLGSQEANTQRTGALNVRFKTGGSQWLDSAQTIPNPDYQSVNAVKIAEVTDGTSNTAIFSETKRSRAVQNTTAEIPFADLINVYVSASTEFSGAASITPPADCQGSSQIRIRYRGQMYYRNLPSTSMYSHAVPPNWKLWDCTNNTGFNQVFGSARSYHSGGVNVAFIDGSVRFIKDTISPVTWAALGSRAGGEIISADSY